MKFREIAAALKQKYRPIFRGGIDDEVRQFKVQSLEARAVVKEITGPGRAISALTEGKGE